MVVGEDAVETGARRRGGAASASLAPSRKVGSKTPSLHEFRSKATSAAPIAPERGPNIEARHRDRRPRSVALDEIDEVFARRGQARGPTRLDSPPPMTKWPQSRIATRFARPSASHQPISRIRTIASSRPCAAAAVTSSARTAAALPRWPTSVGSRPSIAASRVSRLQSPARGVALPATVTTAEARRAVRLDDHVADLTRETAATAHQLAVGDDAATDAGTEGHHDEVVDAAPGAPLVLGRARRSWRRSRRTPANSRARYRAANPGPPRGRSRRFGAKARRPSRRIIPGSPMPMGTSLGSRPWASQSPYQARSRPAPSLRRVARCRGAASAPAPRPSTRPSRATTSASALVPPTSTPIATSIIGLLGLRLQLAERLGLDPVRGARLDERGDRDEEFHLEVVGDAVVPSPSGSKRYRPLSVSVRSPSI